MLALDRCPSENELIDYVDGRSSLAAELERHLDACSVCTAILAGLATPHPGEGDAVERDLCEGDAIGRYRVHRRIGRGAMGVVYQAYDPELARSVAIKVVRSTGSISDPRARTLVLREAQALARLSHPHVVPVLAAVEHDDEIHLVMELVEGPTIRAWLSQSPRRWREIVDVYVAAAHGLAASHRAAVVHRDFKPDNVVVGTDGRVRVIDFGLARIRAEPAGLPQAVTLRGDEHESSAAALIGTPAYMAPEQLAGHPAGPRSDQYALAVSLWEGLYGARPVAAKSGERPPRRNLAVPRRIRDALRRALSPDPHFRFADMDAFAKALQQPRRPWRAATVAAVCVLASSVAWAASSRSPTACASPESTVQYESMHARLTATLDAAPEAIAHSRAAIVDLVEHRHAEWLDAHAQLCGITPRSPIERAASFTCLETLRLELAAAIDVLAEADASLLARAVDMLHRLPPIGPCLHGSDHRLVFDGAGAIADRSLRADLARARALGDAGRLDDAHTLAEAVWTLADEHGDAALRAEAAWRVGLLYLLHGEPAPAVPWLEAAYFEARAIGHDEVESGAALALVEVHGLRRAHVDEAEHWLPAAEAALQRWNPAQAEAELEHQRGSLAQRDGRNDLALEHHRRALRAWQTLVDADDPRLARAFESTGIAFQHSGDWESALDHHQHALEIRERWYGEEHPYVSYSLNNIALALVELDMPDAALDHHEWSLAIAEATFGPEHLQSANVNNNLGALWGRMGEPGPAARHFAIALPAFERLGADHPDLEMVLRNLGFASLEAGDFDTAVEALERALAISETREGAAGPSARTDAAALGRALSEREAHTRALTLIDRALQGDEPLGWHEPVGLALLHLAAARSRLARGDRELATTELAAARVELARATEQPPELLADLDALGETLR